MKKVLALFLLSACLPFCTTAGAQDRRERLPNLDLRPAATATAEPDEHRDALARLRSRLPKVRVDRHEITGAPRMISAVDGFLTGPRGEGGAVSAGAATNFAGDPDQPTKVFLREYRGLFGHGPEALARARVKRESVGPNNGLRTMVWQQQVLDISVFEAVLVSHTTRNGELVNISSAFMPDPEQAVTRASRAAGRPAAVPVISPQAAVRAAAANVGEAVREDAVQSLSAPVSGAERRQAFRVPGLLGDTTVALTWLPMNAQDVRLCWDVILTSRSRGEMFRLLVDAGTGDVLVRRCLTEYLTPASFRVFASDSPSPFSPGLSSPASTQPALTSRVLVTLTALDTNASPHGWIEDDGNETVGNNVDAHTDRNDDDLPDVPRPQGASRVFDFAMDLGQNPTNYSPASVVQLFYLCNWMHDKLYELGFTEAAGNFQSNNFGRGGYGSDAVQADAQDGGGYNNANFSTPPDGSPGRMQMYIFDGPTPQRDGDLDADIVLHEFTHGLSNRRVGGGIGISALQSRGVGEGWSDFYGLSLLSEAGDNVNGCYAAAGYATYQLSGLTQNYYYGIRRYPYSTDMTKNPLTFKDIDPSQASSHTGVPRSPIVDNTANEVHNMGEVWCVTLWDARANVVNAHGWDVGNQLMLQLVTDGMNLSPANPTFVQARDAILQADLVDTGGTNRGALWTAFAKRGLGVSATSPASSTTTGVVEAYDLPDDLLVSPSTGLASGGEWGGPFSPSCQVYLVKNTGSNALTWTAWTSQPWVGLAPSSGDLAPGASTNVSVCLTPAANALSPSNYSAVAIFSNSISSVAQTRTLSLSVSLPRVLFVSLDTDPGWSRQGEWAFGKPAGLGGGSSGSPDPSAGATGSNVFGINLNGNYSTTLGGPYYLTAGPFDFGGYTGMQLQFKRWLNSDYPPYVYASIEISTNGLAWSPVWTNVANTFITDSAWTTCSYDISARADGQHSVYIRWSHRIASSGVIAMSGWNIDDIEFLGAPALDIDLVLPASATEGDSGIIGTIAMSPISTSNVVVGLTSSDTSEVVVPAQVIVLAGESNATFAVTIVDDAELDGVQNATITASLSGYPVANRSIAVFDNETATLGVTLPGSVPEGQVSVSGSVTVSTAPTVAVPVSLSSADTSELQVPATVTLPAGATSVSFVATSPDDIEIDGTQPVLITAHVAGWTDGSAVVNVLDNENRDLSLTVPGVVWENAGVVSNLASVSISGTLPTNFTINLSSTVPDRLQVPASTIISAGSTQSTFNLLPVDNPVIDGAQLVQVSAAAPGFTGATGAVVVLDDETPLPPFDPSPADLATHVAQNTALAWQNSPSFGRTITNDVYFGTNSTPVAGDFAGSTTNAAWTLPLLAPLTTYYWRVIVHGGGSATGAVWQFTTRGVDHFDWDAVASPQVVGVPFPVTVAARDEFGGPVPAFHGTAEFTGRSGTEETNEILGDALHEGSYSGTYTLGYAFTPDSDMQVTHVRSYSGTKVSVWQDDGTLVLSQAVSGAEGAWTETPLASPVILNAGVTYRIGFYTAGGSYYYRTITTNRFPNGALVDGYYYSGTDGFPSNYINPSELVFLVDLRYVGVGAGPVAVSPAVSDPFTNGVWSGLITVQQPGTNVTLRADAGDGHHGYSNPFDAVLRDDLSLTISDSPDPVPASAPLTYTLTVQNSGPSVATGVTVTNVLSSSVDFVSATSSQGTCTQDNHVVTCALGTVDAGSNATVIIVVTPAFSNTSLTNTATVYRAEPETYLSNNVATAITTVPPPTFSVANASVTEGNVGIHYAVFPVSLDFPSEGTLTVNYYTSDGLAIAGSDYVYTTGVLTFPPGATNASIPVPVIGDTLIEPDESFSLNVWATNAAVSGSPAAGMILNDDGLPGDVYSIRWEPLGQWQFVEQPFPATLSVRDASGIVASNFNGTVSLSASVGGSSVPLDPVVTGEFTNGWWSGDLAVLQAATNLVLLGDDGDGHFGSSQPINVVASNQPPVFVTQPTNAWGYLAGTAGFQAQAFGAPPFGYQWRFNGAPIPGATNATLALTHLTLDQAGSYSVILSNSFGSASSAKVNLSIVQVVAWGAGSNYTGSYNNYGQSVVPPGLTNAVELAGGGLHSLAVRADGRMSAWGAGTNASIFTMPYYTQSVVPPIGNVIAVAAGAYHSLALRNDRTLVAWGAGTNYSGVAPLYGQCNVPAAATNVVAIAAADYNSIALRSDGRVLVWGYNGYSQTNVPTAATSNVVAIAARGSHVLALRADGTLVHWGSLTSLPGSVSNIVAIAAGANHCIALKADGTLAVWGSQVAPVGLSNVVDIAAGQDHSVALKSDGTVVTWGVTNTYGRWAIPPGLSNVIGVACGGFHSLAFIGDGSPLIRWSPVNQSVNLGQSATFNVRAVGPALKYRWQLNESDIPGATNAAYRIPGVQSSHAGDYRVIVTNGFGATTSSVASLTVLAPLATALDAPGMVWSTSGNAAWFGQTAVTHDGTDAAQSGSISNTQQSSVQTTITGAGAVGFWWKVSSEEYFDFLNFYVDGVLRASISGDVDWRSQTIPFGTGSHTLKWTYVKDASVSAGADAAWLDQVAVVITNPPTITLHPFSRTNMLGDTVQFAVAAVGDPPLSYQWRRAGTNLSGEIGTILTLTNVNRRDSGIYAAVVSNPGGSTSSSNAVLRVYVPQQLLAGGMSAAGFILWSGDLGGGLLTPADLDGLEVQASTNLLDWVPLPYALSVSNGLLFLQDTDSTNYPERFYRVLEH